MPSHLCDLHVPLQVYYCNDLLLPEVPLDGDDPDHMLWIVEKAQQRADEYGIEGVTYRLAQGMPQNNSLICGLGD